MWMSRMAVAVCLLVVASDVGGAADEAGVRAVIRERCLDCHDADLAKGGIRLDQLDGDPIAAEPLVWQQVQHVLALGAMPPADKPQPSAVERQQLIAWIDQGLARTAARLDGDPGVVPARRLTNAEYERIAQTLTGVPLAVAAKLPPDPIAGEGFANVATALRLDADRLARYASVADGIAAQVRVRPSSGLTFRSTPGVRADAERTKEIEREIAHWFAAHGRLASSMAPSGRRSGCTARCRLAIAASWTNT